MQARQQGTVAGAAVAAMCVLVRLSSLLPCYLVLCAEDVILPSFFQWMHDFLQCNPLHVRLWRETCLLVSRGIDTRAEVWINRQRCSAVFYIQRSAVRLSI